MAAAGLLLFLSAFLASGQECECFAGIVRCVCVSVWVFSESQGRHIWDVRGTLCWFLLVQELTADTSWVSEVVGFDHCT